MTRPRVLRPGIHTLLNRHGAWLRGARVGLLSHPAALDETGTSSAQLLHDACGDRLTALFGPEHGFFGSAGAGAAVANRRHPAWRLPIHSLYGPTRRPTGAMLRGIDVLVVDLQDLPVRCYTYVSTLRYVMEAAAAHGKVVIVADRPVPLPSCVDGPITRPGFESFVAAMRSPMVYGMTPGESALWIRRQHAIDVDVRVAGLRGYQREALPRPAVCPWVPPSPGIASWESARCYPATVFCEALGAIDFGRGTGMPFQLVGAPWLQSEDLADHLESAQLPGVAFHAHPYVSAHGAAKGKVIGGVRIAVTRPDRFRPVTTAIVILHGLQQLHGIRRVWGKTARPAFFDQLFGTDAVREALLDGESAAVIAGGWRRELAAFRKMRREILLYPGPSVPSPNPGS